MRRGRTVRRAPGAPIVWVAGNHDERPALREGLFDAAPTHEPVTAVHDLGGLRFIALDSTVPGWHHGDLDDAQLAWLRDTLAEPAPLGTILALHHPPLPSHIPFFDILELRHQDALAAAIAGTDVRAILAGHLHYATAGTFAGVPVSVASATCYTMNLQRPPAEVNGMDAGQSFHSCTLRRHHHARRGAGRRGEPDSSRQEWVGRWPRSAPPSARRVLAQR